MTRRSVIAAIALAVALAGCGRGGAGSPAPGGATFAGSGARGDVGLVRVTPAELGRLVRDNRGHVTLMNVWATWCAPCREEMPALLAAARANPDVRLLLVSCDLEDRQPAVLDFLAERGVGGTAYLKTGSDQEFIDIVSPNWTGSIPATIVYDASGRRVAFWEGAASQPQFAAALVRARSSRP